MSPFGFRHLIACSLLAGAPAWSAGPPPQDDPVRPTDLRTGLQALPASPEIDRKFLSELPGRFVIEAVKAVPYPAGQKYLVFQRGRLMSQPSDVRATEPFCVLHRDLSTKGLPTQTRLGLLTPDGDAPRDPYTLKDFIFPLEANTVGLREWQCLRQEPGGTWRLLTVAELRQTLGTENFRLLGWRPSLLAQAR